ncbi:MAG: AbrB/MazE/SpoVT family DNA-binding domain-containing protein, partial [Synergistaceae bacterium]|nr:AbrB/MazE/SpoVT family DNA-binding domain-containing protein [Synergistaceae bacterium]
MTVAVLRSHSQITISAPVVSSLGLKEGDQLEIFADNGKISMIPVAVYPDDYVEQLRRETAELRDNIKSGKQPVFDSV